MPQKNPYLIEVRDLMGRPGEMRERELSIIAPETFGEALAQVREGTEVHIDLKLESVHEGVLVTADVDTTMDAECGRCLETFATPFHVEIQELFAYTPSEAEESLVQGDHVDLEPTLRDAVVLALPFQPVCRPDCPGLDPESGELRDVEAEGLHGGIVDPRWAALAGFAETVTEPVEAAESNGSGLPESD